MRVERTASNGNKKSVQVQVNGLKQTRRALLNFELYSTVMFLRVCQHRLLI